MSRLSRHTLFLITAAAQFAVAQGVTVRGVVVDSLHRRPLAGATVFAVNTPYRAITDSAGRFTFANVAPATYRVLAQHDVIDALGMSAVGGSFTVGSANETIQLAVPSFTRFWQLTCGEQVPRSDTGFVFGSVRRSRGSSAVTGATVSVSWIDLQGDGRSVWQKQKTLEVPVDSAGNYALCGVPTRVRLSIQAEGDSAHSGTYDIGPVGAERLARRDLRLVSLESAAGDSVGATLRGRVFADSGRQPLADADLAITDLGLNTVSTAAGQFQFRNVFPGSHTITVRHIGYAEIEVHLDLDDGESRETDFNMRPVVILDSVKIVGRRLARDEGLRVFDEHRKMGLGKFLTEEDMDKANGRRLPAMLMKFNNVRFGRGRNGAMLAYSTRGSVTMGGSKTCQLLLYVNGVRDPLDDVDQYPPEFISGVELYLGPSQIPPEYAMKNSCGVIAITTRK